LTPQKDIQGRILIADDEAATVEMLTDLLTGEGYEVVGVGNGTAVLEKLQDDPGFGLLLMDLQMPGVNGLELMERLNKEGSEIPVILITAYGTSSSSTCRRLRASSRQHNTSRSPIQR
jgi:two-component system response regulator AtoC